MARIPAPASSPGLPASLLRKLNTAQVFFPSTHLESLGFRICVEGSGSQSLCCLHPRGDKCPPRLMYLLPFYTGVSRGAALERDLRPLLSGILWPHPSRAALRPHFPGSLTILCPVSLKSQEYDGGGHVTPPSHSWQSYPCPLELPGSKVDFSTSCILGAVLGVASWAAVLHGL